jgi:hypothetical protein
MQLELADIKRRIDRLERLALGLAREAAPQPGAVDLLLYRERKQYLKAVRDALAGVEAGRVVLARAVRRMEGG